MKRTHHCSELRLTHVGQKVDLVGWVDSRRDHGGIVFIDLRDREGVTQIVFDPTHNKRSAEMASDLRSEFVVHVEGVVRKRPDGTANLKLPTGEIEVLAHQLQILNEADVPPFQLDAADQVSEDLRLTYRYLDLRRPRMFGNLRLRHRAAKIVRDYFDEQGFLEVETPMLFKSTPEGAREYLVPSRVNPGKFYALPQSPQQFKQLLMVAGVEKYWQLARCFRDEDLRADRQPEFTQIDVEQSFVTREDIYTLIEGMIRRVWKGVLGVDLPQPLPRVTFQEALDRYGIDKPDRRFALELADVTEVFRGTQFKVFANAINSDGVIKALNAKGFACATQGQIDALTDAAKSFGAKGLAWIKAEGGDWKSPIVKYFSAAEREALKQKLGVEEGDLVLFAADEWLTACEILGRIRLLCAQYLQQLGKLKIPATWDFLWVVDFPLITFDKESGRYVSSHHPFTAPVAEDVPWLDSDPTRVRGQHYDIVVNGVELGGGSIRIHQPALQKKVFEDVLKIPPEVAQNRFGYFLKAFAYGAPPHGGIALGFDRMCALLAGTDSIRDVIAFPKTAKAVDLTTNAPGDVEPKQLRDLHIQVVGIEQKPT
jgi:aspartyl-tRNA synthetase